MLLGIKLLLLLKVNAARHNLQLLVNVNAVEDDEEGMDCLPNATIFKELTRIGAKTTAWNEFSSTVAFAMICLATNQKFNFSKYIFESMVKNLDNAGKFLMYPRFIQVFLDNQLEGMAIHNRIYIAPSHTKKIFANMKRQGKDFSGRVTPLFPTMVVQAQEEMGEGSTMPTDPHHTPIITQPSSSQPQRKQKSRRPKRKDTEIPHSSVPSDLVNVADEAVNEEPSMQLNELMDFVPNCNKECLTWRIQRLLKLRRLQLGRSARVVSSNEASLGDQEDASKQGRKIDDIDVDAEITLVDETQERHDDDLMFDTCVLNDEEVFAGQDMAEKEVSTVDPVTTTGKVVTTANVEVSTASPTTAKITNVELTLAQTLAELKSARPKTKGVVMQEPSESTPTISLQLSSQAKGQGSKDKGKAKMIEPEKPLKKKDQIKFDEEEALRLQAAFDEEDRLAREKAQQVEEANIAWDDIQAKIDADYQLAERLQAQEQQELTIKEKSTLFQQLLEKRRKFFTAKRAEEKRNRPPTRAQQRSIMYMDTELVEEKAKKQKVDDDQEATKMKELMKIVPDKEEVAVDAIPLATKPLSIVDYKIIKEGKINNYQIIRADGSSKRYSAFIQMLRSFDREDLKTLWKLVKAKNGYTRPEEGYERVL
ncbi:hypothetical protein Tco_0943370 [Tanacetum coccineum]